MVSVKDMIRDFLDSNMARRGCTLDLIYSQLDQPGSEDDGFSCPFALGRESQLRANSLQHWVLVVKDEESKCLLRDRLGDLKVGDGFMC